MRKAKTPTHVLGLMVTSRAVHAALLERDGEGPPRLLKTFLRQRGPRFGAAQAAPTPANLASVHDDGSATDFTLQIGGGDASSQDLFMASEFTGLEADPKVAAAPKPGDDTALPFTVELLELLDECRALGIDRPALAFAVGAADVTHTELVVPAGKKAASREKLLVALAEKQATKVREDLAAFLPMTSREDDTVRTLALSPRPSAAIAETLEAAHEQPRRIPNARALDTEAALYLGLTRAWADPQADEAPDAATDAACTLVVRAGLENTLVLFVRDGRIHHFESMRSLTAYDAPETICSRVLLQQDEYGIEEVARVLVLSEEREGDLLGTFETFFPMAEVGSLRATLKGAGIDLGGGEAPLVAAVAVALRAIGAPGADRFADVNLLPKRLRRQKIELPFTWHVLALSALLFVTTLFFVYRYVAFEIKIDAHQQQLRMFPPTLAEAETVQLQARIDSLRAISFGYAHSLDLIDSLLVGSDRWSRTLAHVSREAAATTGLWIDQWQPSGSEIRLMGSATSRDRVVEFADRVEGSVRALRFSEVRDWPVYTFELTMPLPNELPEAATYLRANAPGPAGAAAAPPAGPSPEPAAPAN